MKKVAEFVKVSKDLYREDFLMCYYDFLDKHPEQVALNDAGLVDLVNEGALYETACIVSTMGSYNVSPNFSFVLKPGEAVVFNTGFKVKFNMNFELDVTLSPMSWSGAKGLVCLPACRDSLLSGLVTCCPGFNVYNTDDLFGNKKSDFSTKGKDAIIEDLHIYVSNPGTSDVLITQRDIFIMRFREVFGATVFDNEGKEVDVTSCLGCSTELYNNIKVPGVAEMMDIEH